MDKITASGNKEKVIKELAIGTPMREIAKEVGNGVSKDMVSKFGKKEEIRSLVEAQQMRLLEVVPDAVENVKGLVIGMKDLEPDDHRGKKLAYEASFDVLRAVGIMPSPVQSQVINNIYNEKVLISPFVQDLLDERDKRFGLLEGAIDAEKTG